MEILTQVHETLMQWSEMEKGLQGDIKSDRVVINEK